MTLCGHVGVNDALCNREKDAVFLIENAGERASDIGALVIGTLRRCDGIDVARTRLREREVSGCARILAISTRRLGCVSIY